MVHSFRSIDLEKSTEENYETLDDAFTGKYNIFKRQLDYSYHKHYSMERQMLHDYIIDLVLGNNHCARSNRQWIGE
jgi:hypothetical protein